jgi:4-amino-4-deoxy-L-arabinose transferase-like glycosyltransferase
MQPQRARRRLRRPDAAAIGLLFVQLVLVGWMGLVTSPNVDEVAHLSSGISHWQYARFDLYRVNPPLVRGIAALPVLLADPETDYTGWQNGPYTRSEFGVGRAFAGANGSAVFWYVTLARWACLPFHLMGGWICYRWASRLFSPKCGLVAATLYTFSPNILAYGASITPDAGAAAFGLLAGYAFWHWLQAPRWANAVKAGIALGLAELTKTTWIVLFGLWPCLWIAWRVFGPKRSGAVRSSPGSLCQLTALLLIGLYLINLGYGLDGSFRPLGRFRFISHTLSGQERPEEGANRFAGTALAWLLVPVPEDYLRGIDVQRFDFEQGKWSYLRGEQKHGGWWYYYLYALAVKLPVGTLLLLGLAICVTLCRSGYRSHRMNEVALLLPAVVVLLLVSSQTGFTRSVRYVLPCLPFLLVWTSKVALSFDLRHRFLAVVTLIGLAWGVLSSLLLFPHGMSYFNELAGGPRRGHVHLLDANIDWGQDLLFLKRWYDEHPQARPLHLAFFSDLFFDPDLVGVQWPPVPVGPTEGTRLQKPAGRLGPQPGWHAVSVNHLYGYRHLDSDEPVYTYLQQFRPIGSAGYSIYIFHVTLQEANRVRRRLGLPEIRGERQTKRGR